MMSEHPELPALDSMIQDTLRAARRNIMHGTGTRRLDTLLTRLLDQRKAMGNAPMAASNPDLFHELSTYLERLQR